MSADTIVIVVYEWQDKFEASAGADTGSTRCSRQPQVSSCLWAPKDEKSKLSLFLIWTRIILGITHFTGVWGSLYM